MRHIKNVVGNNFSSETDSEQIPASSSTSVSSHNAIGPSSFPSKTQVLMPADGIVAPASLEKQYS